MLFFALSFLQAFAWYCGLLVLTTDHNDCIIVQLFVSIYRLKDDSDVSEEEESKDKDTPQLVALPTQVS